MSTASQSLDHAKSTLIAGGVVLLATDTVLGLVALPSHANAVDKVFDLKKRPRAKNLPIMIANADQLVALGGKLTPTATALLCSDYMPGPLTIAVELDLDATPDWLSGRDECAVRIPDDAFLLSLLTDLGPLLVTSANLSGQDTPPTTAQALMHLNGAPNYVIHGSAKSQIPSSLVNCRAHPAKIERVGAVSAAVLQAILERSDA
ncbi:L-threonylcarbamoyladenylate synthase [Pacificibacter marinus]|uniref:L-threonylcarbamoyladenylate synthase n=1 Tax=Pacificibacter marinus TaxID=658057 RepID=A0A1Y5SKL1_9RHOB|nr:L-threonylcarbamoyladenylate synthase [Pacificibacter marinus]SEK58055.1 L-threonylcarbamoyladenylate synthase [Pacificibacter marinus]SLN42980.1 Threonylcarbamoyl-AMP synthase [Pacificibacter marinus]